MTDAYRRLATVELIGLCGYARAGKDATAAVLARFGYQRVAFADKLRDLALEVDPIAGRISQRRLSEVIDGWGWERAKNDVPEVRALLQRLGTGARKVLGDDVWVNAALASVGPLGSYVFTDVRFPNEADAIRARGGRIWRITRPGVQPVNGHPSETAMDGYHVDAELANVGTLDDLAHSAISVLAQPRQPNPKG